MLGQHRPKTVVEMRPGEILGELPGTSGGKVLFGVIAAQAVDYGFGEGAVVAGRDEPPRLAVGHGIGHAAGGEGDGGQPMGGGLDGDHAETLVIAGQVLYWKDKYVSSEIGSGKLRIILCAFT